MEIYTAQYFDVCFGACFHVGLEETGQAASALPMEKRKR